jgi:hypothetical protein
MIGLKLSIRANSPAASGFEPAPGVYEWNRECGVCEARVQAVKFVADSVLNVFFNLCFS